MLTCLSIQNYALISSLEIEFSGGFSVITGETGAGKSIILGALSLILGQRADVKSIKQGEAKCLIEGVFDISQYGLQTLFSEKDWEYDEKHCILRRELFNSGKSRAFINDTPVTLNDLKDLGEQLIDIHSQHQNLMLGNDFFQIHVIDALAQNKHLLNAYRFDYQVYIALQKELRLLKEEASRNAEEEDYLQFQFQQLEEAGLKPEEQEELETEAEVLSHVEEIKSNLYRIEQVLSDDERGTIISLKEVVNLSLSLSKIFPQASEYAQRLEVAYLDIKDLAKEINGNQERLEFNPERLQFVNERLDLLYTLQQKHKVDSNIALIELKNNIEKKLATISNMDEQIRLTQEKLDKSYQKLLHSAEALSHTRKESANRFEKDIVEKVSLLGMPNMRFSCELELKPSPDVNGMDRVNFLFSANKNVPLKPVSDIASGGEISRLMLGIKALIAGAMALPTIVFDEIDTGVSGEVADKMANIMQGLGDVMQVITITHLPQIAAKGKNHYFVYKEDVEDFTETHIRKLSRDERIAEIAQMLSGAELSDAALENAKNLLKI